MKLWIKHVLKFNYLRVFQELYVELVYVFFVVVCLVFFFFHIVVRQVILVFDSLISFYDFYVFKQSVKSFSQSVVSLVGRSVRSVIESVTLSSGLSVNPYLSLSVYHSVSPSAVVDSVRQSLGQLANQMVDQSVHP